MGSEYCWGKAKGAVARQNGSYKIKDLRQLLWDELLNVSPQNWKNFCRWITVRQH